MKETTTRRAGCTRTVAAAVLTATLGLLVAAPTAIAAPTPASSPSGTPLSLSSPSPFSGAVKPGDGQKPQDLTFGIRPFRAKGTDPRGSFQFRASPGQTVQDEVSVRNDSDVALAFEVYATDATTSAGGGFGLLARAQPPKDVGTWVKLVSPSTGGMLIPPHHQFNIPFTVAVPDSATPGDHVGGIVVSLPGNKLDANGKAVRVDSRVSTLLSFRVSGELRPGLAIAGLSSGYSTEWRPWAPGRSHVSFAVHNQGNISQGASYVVTLHSPLGMTKTLPPVKIPGILAGDSVDVSVPIADVWPAVHYTATVDVLGVPASGDPIAPPVSARSGFWAWPWPQLLALLGLIVLFVGLRRVRRWRRKRLIERLTAAAAPALPEPSVETAAAQ